MNITKNSRGYSDVVPLANGIKCHWRMPLNAIGESHKVALANGMLYRPLNELKITIKITSLD